MTNDNYRDAVMQGGNEKPWKGKPSLSHQDVIPPDEVLLDQTGNILEMPLLRRKPCFGRPETFLRHGKRVRKVRNKWGKVVDSSSHQCGSCPDLTWQSCSKVVMQRVTGNPTLHEALRAWMKDCDQRHGGENVYTQESGRLWVAFKQAIADRGPFTSSNDQALQEEDARKAAEQTVKWRNERARHRARIRKEQRALCMPPSRQFIENAKEERDDRRDALLAVLGRPDQHKSRSKVPEAYRGATAMITANAWFVGEILRESNLTALPGTVARYMVQLGLNEGVAFGTLKARMHADLVRGYQCELDGIWARFDRNRDLDDYLVPDDDASDALLDTIDSIEDVIEMLAGRPDCEINAA